MSTNRLHDAQITSWRAPQAEAAERARRFAQRAAASAAAAAAKGKPPPTLKPRKRDEAPKATANVTDPDSRLLHTRKGRVQGYNAQLEPMVNATAAAPSGERERRRGSRQHVPWHQAAAGKDRKDAHGELRQEPSPTRH